MSLEPIREAFAMYYKSYSSLIFVPEIEKREFMFIDFQGTVKRHMTIKSIEELRSKLERETPLHSYYSVALYENPSAKDMSSKGIESAELLFDIDADLLEVSCRKEHDHWRCENCGRRGMWPPPEECPDCGSKRIRSFKWICPICLEAAKREAFRLMDFLSSDIGIDQEHVLIAYTGNRGYHIRVREKRAMSLDKVSRREIADLISGTDLAAVTFVESGGGVSIPRVGEGGWRGRFSNLLLSILEGNPPSWVDHKTADYLRSIPGIEEALLKGKKLHNIGSKAIRVLRKLVIKMGEEEGVKIDVEVTSDPHRFTRIPNSLHGKSGLRAVTLTPLELDSFEPLAMATGLKGRSIKVKITEPVPEFELGGSTFGPFDAGIEIRLPIDAAAFIILKDRGIPI
ncbi:MAG: hypothetical protein DRO05_01630 [Thermoproteota archaeon]|nr:MAG: hypothetical protein DRO05_01630 [Candidatus Korarchaeota archaeon]